MVKNPPEMQETQVQFLGWENPLEYSWACLMIQLIKNPPAMRETWAGSLGREDPLEKGKAIHSSILAWRIPWTTVHGVTKSWTRLSNFHFLWSPEFNFIYIIIFHINTYANSYDWKHDFD